MKRIALLLVLSIAACSKLPKSTGVSAADPAAPGNTAPALSATAMGSNLPTAAAAPEPGRTATGLYEGRFMAQLRKSTTTTKQGAPSGWEKDDNKKFTGESTLSLSVAPDGTVQGTLKGALGEQTLRGKLQGDELRAAIVPTGSDSSLIQNGFVALKREGDSFKGNLSCASGDALILREASVELKKSAS